MPLDPDALLADAAVEAAVGALAARNQHHLEQMDADEQANAISHWRELAIDVLAAARVVLGDGDSPPGVHPENAPGRAVLVLQDAGGDDLTVHAAFYPDLEEVSPGEVSGTPAQVAAMMMLHGLSDDEDGLTFEQQ